MSVLLEIGAVYILEIDIFLLLRLKSSSCVSKANSDPPCSGCMVNSQQPIRSRAQRGGLLQATALSLGSLRGAPHTQDPGATPVGCLDGSQARPDCGTRITESLPLDRTAPYYGACIWLAGVPEFCSLRSIILVKARGDPLSVTNQAL